MNKQEQDFIVQKIRTQYTQKEYTQLDELKALDRKVTKPAYVFGIVFGIISLLIMGSGMSLVMTEIGAIVGIENAMVVGVVTGVIGMLMAILDYPIAKAILSSRRKKYAAEIVRLSDSLTDN